MKIVVTDKYENWFLKQFLDHTIAAYKIILISEKITRVLFLLINVFKNVTCNALVTKSVHENCLFLFLCKITKHQKSLGLTLHFFIVKWSCKLLFSALLFCCKHEFKIKIFSLDKEVSKLTRYFQQQGLFIKFFVSPMRKQALHCK